MKDEARKFLDCLQDAGQLLEDYLTVNYTGRDHALGYNAPEHFDLALFEKWSEFFEPELQQNIPIRVIQHLSCTGGTIISKCLAGQPNVVLLSEANPFSELQVESSPPGFAPTDLIYLTRRAKFPQHEELSRNIFKAEIGVIAKHARLLGKHLIIREHSHSDFLVGKTPRQSSTIRKLLEDDHQTLSVLTVRHPVDTYLSLTTMDWLHFIPKTFEEFCRRYALFIDSNGSVSIYKYEDFITDPKSVMKRICESIDLPYNEDFMEIFDINALSGDSGRASHVIEKRERRKFDENFQREVEECRGYRALCQRLGYESSLDV